MSDDKILAGLRLATRSLEVFCAHFLKIKDKGGLMRPLLWNKAQRYVHERLEQQLAEMGRVRALVLKGRQQGISTYVGARYYHKTTTRFGQEAFIVAHEQRATDNLYKMVRRYHDHNPMQPSTGATNAKELIFDKLGGGYKLATAGTKDVGRSATAQLLHGCLAPDTPILDGVTACPRRMDEFALGDMVRTHTGAVAPVTVISRQVKFVREVTLRTVSAFPLRATGEHKFWTRSGMKRLDEMSPGDEIGFPIHQISGEVTVEQFRVAPRQRPQGGGSVERVPEKVSLNYDVGRMLGLYLAEGSIQCQSASGEPSAVQFAVHENECDRTIHWLGILAGLITSINVYRHAGSKTVVVTAYGRSFANFVLRMCGKTDDKAVPHQWRTSGEGFARGLLHGYVSGDGGIDSRGRRISATSIRPAITVGMRDICASLGYGWASIDFKAAGVRHGRNERAAHILRLSGDGAARLALEIGKPGAARKRAAGGGNFGATISGGYAWLKIASISGPFESEVMDFEVGHEDHSYCTLQVAASNSEYGFWANAQSHMAGIGNTIGDIPGTEVILESTGNGLGNAFHLMWQDAEAGKTDFIAIFVPWYWQDEYRAPVRPDLQLSIEDVAYQMAYGLDREQMQWRATKIAGYGEGFSWLFDQEYPACVVAGTRVGTSAGLIKIEDASPGMLATMGTIDASNKQPPSQIYKLTTALGYEFRGTWDHPVFTAGGVLLPMMSCKGVDIRLQPPMLAEAQHVERWREFGVDSSIRIDEDFGLLLGLFMGDGSLYDGCVSFCCDARDGDVVAECQRLLRGVLGIASATRRVGSKGGGVEVRAQRRELTAVFDRLGLLREGAGNSGRKRMVCVPECIWRSPRPVVIQFLRGLFESDGFNGYGHPRVTLFSKHKGFLGDIQLLLLALGITSRLGLETSKKGDKTHVGHSLTMRRNESIRFNELVGFISKRKSDKAASWRAVGKTGARRLGIEMVDRVVSVVEDGFEATYDMTIRGGEAFDANGILTHNTAALAFQTGTLNPLVSPSRVMAAVNSTYIDNAGALVIGCDPASDGEGTPDRTAIVFRRGRTAFRVEYHEKLNAMQVAGKLAAYHQEFRPDAIIIDKGGIGAGIYDRLVELNIPVIGIMFAHAADDPERYENKKAEIWWRMREWFEDQPCRIPNNPAFIADICAPQPDVSSNGRKMVEPKNKLEKRQIRSPDGGDALALTFAVKVLPGAGNDVGSGVAREAATTAGY